MRLTKCKCCGRMCDATLVDSITGMCQSCEVNNPGLAKRVYEIVEKMKGPLPDNVRIEAVE